MEGTKICDLFGNEVVYGGIYTYLTSSSGITRAVYGTLVEVKDGKAKLKPIREFENVGLGENNWVVCKTKKTRTIQVNKIFPKM